MLSIEMLERSVKKIVIFIVIGYQVAISPFLKYRCRFCPSCSSYAREAVEVHGVFYGFFLIFKRLLKCHPWYKGEGYDPVPGNPDI